MKEYDFKKIYGNPSEDFHNRVLSSIYQLDEKTPARYQKRKRVMKIALVCAIAAALGTATAVAASTQMFGLFRENVGKYGLKVSVQADATAATEPTEKKHVKLKLGYLPEGYEPMPNTNDLKYSLGGNYDAEGGGLSFFITDAENYDDVEKNVIESYETEFNGHKTIISTRKFTEDSDKIQYFATEYFEDWGYVVGCFGIEGIPKAELIKVLDQLELEEDTNYVEETLPDDYHYDEKRADYAYEYQAEYQVKGFGDSFDWEHYVNYGDKPDDFTIRITSVEERDNSDGLAYDYFLNSGYEFPVYEEYFNDDGTLITPYTRVDADYGDGIDSLTKTWETTADRHFYVVSVDVTSNVEPKDDAENWFDVAELLVLPFEKNEKGALSPSDGYGEANVIYLDRSDEANLARIEKGETRTFTYGIAVDDDILDEAYLYFFSQCQYESDADKTLYRVDYGTCVKLIQ